jgi:hypothetical protein
MGVTRTSRRKILTLIFEIRRGMISMTNIIKQIAIYGKGGIGKSTTTSNISAALSKMGCTEIFQFRRGIAGRDHSELDK